MTAQRDRQGSEQREIEQERVREIMLQDVQRDEMQPGCRRVAKTQSLDELE